MVILTENRRDVLDGESDWSEDAIINEKSRIRSKSRTALGELIEIAQSDQIENRSVFDPEKVGTLLYWILNDPAMFPVADHGGLIGTDDEPPEGVPEDAYLKVPESLQQYRQSVHSEAAQELLRIDHPERGR
ncbi:hypothetical protein PM025_18190 [Halorubrum ezzemoulense]|uniref:hypothetical protein n=1 Tax=Halorubrum ezzemoulense TaxID=337243 RepID=UPI00232FA7A5|nr:hypothetical protein [Halorubrum ezzemoulense]MDB2265997.1 hypothetical protein [Halorubrum ezzemoulense]